MYSLHDVEAILAAVAALGVLFVLPGIALARLSQAFGWREAAPGTRWQIGLLVSTACLPALLSVVWRLLGFAPALAVDLALAVVGGAASISSSARPRVQAPSVAVVAVWLAIIVFDFIDFDVGGGLRQPLMVFDTVEHASLVRAMALSGAPPIDPFFARAGRAGYCYFFFTPAALALRASAGWLDARGLLAAQVFWLGPAVLRIGCEVADRLRPATAGLSRSRRWIVLALLACAGFDMVGLAIRGAAGSWAQSIDGWNPSVTPWIVGFLWTPHHLSGLLSFCAGACLLLSAGEAQWRARAGALGLAALAFADVVGSSSWVALPAALSAGAWAVILAARGRWRLIGAACLVGLLALAIDAPLLMDIARNRAPAGPILAFHVREFSLSPWNSDPEPWRSLGDLVLLPANAILEFGVLALGTTMFWMRRRRSAAPLDDLEALLVASACCGGLMAAFLASTLLDNDLGWRACLLVEFPGLVWTTLAFEDLLNRRMAGLKGGALDLRTALPAGVLAATAVGVAGTAYAIVAARLPTAWFTPWMRFINRDPRSDRDLRGAYEWAAGHLPADMILQHDPAPLRAFDFGLYGRNRVAVADRAAEILGADPKEVDHRIAALAPVFEGSVDAARVRQTARAFGVGALVVSADDPVWSMPRSWVWRVTPAWSTARARIVLVSTLPSPAAAGS